MNFSKTQLKLRATILDKIYAKGPISRIDISKKTGITPATTSSITGDLIQEGLLYELGEDTSDTSVGRKKILLNIRGEHAYFIGCELSEKRFTFVLGDNLGIILERKKYAVSKQEIAEKGSQLVIQHMLDFIQHCPDKEIAAVGMAVPGRYMDDDKITTNNPLWQAVNLSIIRESLPYPIYFSNNVNCMALGKRLLSKQKADENFIYFHLARGMHCSYIYNGEIYGKGNLVIGEIGHTVVFPDGEICGCGRRGCLQTYASEAWLIKKARILYEKAEHSILKSLVTRVEDIQLETLLTAYDLGDVGIITLLHQAVHYLSQSLLNLNMMIDAQKIYLHSPLLTHDTMIHQLYDELHYQPKLLFTELPQIIVEPYSDFTGASSAIALCIQKIWLSYE